MLASQKLDSSAAKRLRKLGSASKCGELPHNASRDINRTLQKETSSAPLYIAQVPMWDYEADSQIQEDVAFSLVHETIDGLVSGGEALEDWVGVELSSALHNTLQDWSGRTGIADEGNLVGVGLWGDAAPFHTRDSVFILLFNILTGKNHARHWVVAFAKRSVCKCGCKGRCTFEGVMRVVVWSLDALAAGDTGRIAINMF